MRCIVYLFLLWPTVYSAVNNLKHVTIIFRHGDRNKVYDVPGDLHTNIDAWPGGYGELNREGKLRNYMMGQFFRERYISTGYAPEYYTPDVYIVKSTDIDRTIMSVATYLAGLLPPKYYQVWNPAINWQPIPIHTIPKSEDATIAMVKDCERYTHLYRSFLESGAMRTLKQRARSISDYVQKHTNISFDGIRQLAVLYDTLFVEKQMNYSLPSYVNDTFLKKLKNVADTFYGLGCYTPKLARLKAGPLINEIIQNIHDDIKSDSRRFRIYSGHDYTVANVLKALGTYNNFRPPYSSAIIFELRLIHKKYYINLLYKNTTDSFAPPEKLTMKGCKFNCPFGKFLKLTANLNIDPATWTKECNNLADINMSASKNASDSEVISWDIVE